ALLSLGGDRPGRCPPLGGGGLRRKHSNGSAVRKCGIRSASPVHRGTTMIEVRVQSLGIDQGSKSPVVILQEADGDRVLPIWIGPGEASAIAMELAGMKVSRPLTHDLAASLIRGMGGQLTRVLITRVEENTYFAELVIQRGSEVFSVDARPSDSIAIALRMQARIFASEELLGDTPPGGGAESMLEPQDEPELGSREEGTQSAEQLQEYLRKLNPEDLGRFNP